MSPRHPGIPTARPSAEDQGMSHRPVGSESGHDVTSDDGVGGAIDCGEQKLRVAHRLSEGREYADLV